MGRASDERRAGSRPQTTGSLNIPSSCLTGALGSTDLFRSQAIDETSSVAFIRGIPQVSRISSREMPSSAQLQPTRSPRHRPSPPSAHATSLAPREEFPLGRHLAKRLVHYFGTQRRDSFSLVVADRAKTLKDFLALYRREAHPLVRLAQTGRIVEQVEHLHRLLDSASRTAGAGDGEFVRSNKEPELLARWRYFWLRERQQRVHYFEELLAHSFEELVPKLESQQLEVLTLLRDDVDRHGSRRSGETPTYSTLLPIELELEERVFAIVTHATGLMVTHVPSWFTSRFDLATQRRRWQQAPDLVIHHLSDPLMAVTEERCAALANDWSKLAHPLVASLRGACHVGVTPFIVYERGPSLIGSLLHERLTSQDQNSTSIRWRALFEAALALRFLHSRGTAHEVLSCSDILVSRNFAGSKTNHKRVRAKLAGYNLREACDHNAAKSKRPRRHYRDSPWRIWSVWQWLAPERIMGAGPSAAADIFSLGMCILESAQLGAPWGGGRHDEFPYQVGHRLVLAGVLPPRPSLNRLSDSQWALVQRMCTFNPKERPEVSSVIAELKRFAIEEDEKDRVDQNEASVLGEKRKLYELDASKLPSPGTELEVDGKALVVRVASTAMGAKRVCRE